MRGYAPGWQLRCLKCGFVQDAGEAGSIRIGAASWGAYRFGRCPSCRRLWFRALERTPRGEGALEPARSPEGAAAP